MNVHDRPDDAPGPETNADLVLNGSTTQLPVRAGTLGPNVVDVSRL